MSDPADLRPVGIVLVSHSAALADGVAELARQMAPDVPLLAAGGADDGGLGTSFERISEALGRLPDGGGIVLYDLGSALLTTETALEFLDPDEAIRIALVDAPLVEGAVAAAVAAQGGAGRAAVAEAARSAGGPAVATGTAPAPAAGPELTTNLELRNPLGLHARPAADVARALTGLDATVTVGRPGAPPVEARSLLAVVRLGLRGGDVIELHAAGPDAETALTRIRDLAGSGFGELSPAATSLNDGPAPAEGDRPGAPGRARGTLARAGRIDVPERRGADPSAERTRLDAALDAARRQLDGGDALARAHAVLLADPELRARAETELAAGWAAETAWWRAAQDEAAALAASSDPVISGRAVDVSDAAGVVLAELGLSLDRVPAAADGLILLADELGPGEVTRLVERGGAGLVLSRGTATAHAVVVARNLGLPLVLGGSGLAGIADGTAIAIDGSTGAIEISPSGPAETGPAGTGPAIDADPDPVVVAGRPVTVAANIGSAAEARVAVARGADGVGLLRTELLMLDRAELPDEHSQVDELHAIFEILGQRPVVVRVLDAGGDKPVRALALDPQHHGFLGVRGLRWLLAHPEVLHTQLRAIARAAVGHQVAVMAPMVTVAAEARAFRAAVAAAIASLRQDGLAYAELSAVGVMIEVPAAALAADEIGAEVDFVSIGTNDLVSYTMAADRTEPGVAELLDPGSTAIIRLLDQLCRSAGVPVHVCGELAADPDFARRFVELGVVELSMAAPRIPEVKRLLRG